MRRVAAIVLPRLAYELGRRRGSVRGGFGSGGDPSEPGPVGPCGVIVTDEPELEPETALEEMGFDSPRAGAEQLAACTLAAVEEQAWRYGVRPGQRVAEATTYVGGLRILRIGRDQIQSALGQVAEVALAFGTTAAIALGTEGDLQREAPLVCYPGGSGAGPADTVWLDISGCARLVGGEDLLGDDLRERVQELGFAARVAVADGPRIAQSVARWGRGERIVPRGCGAKAIEALPIAALPLGAELLGWLGKLGILHIGDLVRLERAQLAARLGPRASDLLSLLEGRDDVPLLPYEPPRRIVERASFEHELDGIEPLLFVMGSLVSRASLRLQARGEAASQVEIALGYDRAIARLRGIEPPRAELTLELPVPLFEEEPLLRAVRAKLDAFELGAPVRSVGLQLTGLTEARRRQLHLSRERRAEQQALPALLGELCGWLGAPRVGVLRVIDSHRPEARSPLAPAEPGRRRRAGETIASPEPTRLLPQPLYVGKLEAGQLVSVARHLFVVDGLRLQARIDGVEWWTPRPVSRDYARGWLHTAGGSEGSSEQSEAWVYVDRTTGRGYLHGWFE